ncbi:putative transposase-like protein [Advenella mimigardefordensis DPN7]|uniref:Putative transposase-like protein n=1 Tax=Advenella mimigardefordensis (strain DSM 17166 / LMG 22922 / DPN7) TaxID=1247726 RepID=W0PH55_ADVMD|nr:putative transposase-like protein [Advenella mimigardefordensis DPN7]
MDEAKRGMENALRANPLDIKGQYESQIKDLQQAYGEAINHRHPHQALNMKTLPKHLL